MPEFDEAPRVNLRILCARNQPVVLDKDLAKLYGVTTSALNQAVKRNSLRFPEMFSFILSNEELSCLRSQIVISNAGRGGRRYPPRVFTEHGCLMAATVLRSDKAISMSIYIIEAFVKMREELVSRRSMLQRLAEMEKQLMEHDASLRDLHLSLLPLLEPPPLPERRKAGFHPETD